MKVPSVGSGIGVVAAIVAAVLAVAPRSSAQYGSSGQPAQQQQQAQQPAKPGAQAPPAQQAEAPKKDPEEEKAYTAFNGVNVQDSDKVIQLGEQFLQKYPTSSYRQSVYSRLTSAYYNKQPPQIGKMYASADKALELNPDDVSVLVLVGWVIPHSSDPNDLDAERRLNKAEGYEKHALELLGTMPKPANLTDDQFAKTKAQALLQAHEGLGLVYFRQQKFAESAAELQVAEKSDPRPDATDLYVTGMDFQQLKRYAEAADAFQKCGQIAGGLQDRCKQYADAAKKQAASQPAPPAPPKN
jgi:tetratricopeptide (TPR) repeat protein